MDYKEDIIRMISSIQNSETLEYLNRFIGLFLEKWGDVGMREVYIERTIEIIHQLDTARLKKVYTVAKTLLEFFNEKGGAA